MEPKKILIVGGGPVGLITAIGIKENPVLAKKFSVTVLESRPTYDRKNIILLDQTSYNLVNKWVKIWNQQDPLGCFVLSPSQDTKCTCYLTNDPKNSFATVPIYLLEIGLWEHAKKLGIRILKPQTKEENFNIRIEKNAIFLNDKPLIFDIVVGADGANSKVREIMLGVGTTEKIKPAYGLVITEQMTKEEMGGIQWKPETDLATQKIQHEFRAFRTPFGLVYLALLLNTDQHKDITQALEKKQIPSWVYTKISEVCNLIHLSKCVEIKPENISIFPVRPTFSERFSRLSPFPIYLVGDSLVNANFFSGSGLNVGIAGASLFLQLLEKYSDGLIPEEVYRKEQQAGVKQLLTKAAQIVGDQDFLQNQDQNQNQDLWNLAESYGFLPVQLSNEIGVKTGAEAGFVVFEIAKSSVEWWWQFYELNGGYIQTLTVIGPTGVLQVYFLWDQDLANIKSKENIAETGINYKTDGDIISPPLTSDYTIISGWDEHNQILINQMPNWLKIFLTN